MKPSIKAKISYFHAVFIALSSIVVCAAASHADVNPSVLDTEAGITEKLGQLVDTTLKFINQDGKEVRLSELFIEGRPTLLTPVYFHCPEMCGLTLEGIRKSIAKLPLKLGKDYSLITVSFNPAETAKDAREKAAQYIDDFSDQQETSGWHFLTGDVSNINTLLDNIGFSVKPDGVEFAHAAAGIVITPHGKISRYIYGINYPEKELRLSLVEASRGKIGSTVDKILLYCFRYDPTKGKYTLAIMNVTRVVSIAIVLVLAISLLRMRLTENRQDNGNV